VCKDSAEVHCGLFTDIKVLDEADRLLAPSFSNDLAHLFGALSKDRQTALFTATWTPSINSIADAAPKPGKQNPFIHKITSTYVMMSKFHGSLELKIRPQS
jgi:superfamily II DNA/RNA helicase